MSDTPGDPGSQLPGSAGGGARGNRNDGLLGWEASQHFFAGLEEEKIKEKKCFLIGLFPWKKLIFFSKKNYPKIFFY